MKKSDFEDEFDFHKAWSACAGRLTGLRTGGEIVAKAAIDAFIAKDDKVAYMLRDIMSKIEVQEKQMEQELREFINEATQ